MEEFQRFRAEYPEFIYKGYQYTETDLSIDMVYHFEIPGLREFHPTWSIAKLEARAGNIDRERLDELVFSLGMVELISYWKITCSPIVYVENRTLTTEQIKWWKKLYLKGLGEFFYTNGISVGDDFMKITCSESAESKVILHDEIHGDDNGQASAGMPKVLVPIGGGKDSAVTLELLKNKTDRFCYIINPRQATRDTVDVAELNDNTIIAKRTIDKNMIELNAKGFLNGHTPFSAIVAFSSVIAAYINGLKYIALSNESSANESTVADSDVNHQYSKSYEFEIDFRNYESEYINSGVEYFSMLRPLTELKIAQLFATFKQYHSIFRSCNVGSKTDIWCGNCPKCLFVYIILSPFLEEKELIDIFGKNMLNDESLVDTFEKLVGLQLEKPFECVGSRDEVNVALQMTIQKYDAEGLTIPFLLKYYEEKVESDSREITNVLDCFDNNHSLPTYFVSIIKQKLIV